MNKMECENCKNYIPHYIKVNGYYEEHFCGTCKLGSKLKIVYCCEKGCQYFKPKHFSNYEEKT